MPRFVAFLRGVSPVNAKMPALKVCFENAGFSNVRTLLSSGNVVFDARAQSTESIERAAQAALRQDLGREFPVIVRRLDALQALLETDPYAAFKVPPEAKRVVSFLRAPATSKLKLPFELDGARVLCVVGTEVFTAYVPSANGPVFMTLIEKAFGTAVTTRTWATVAKCAAS